MGTGSLVELESKPKSSTPVELEPEAKSSVSPSPPYACGNGNCAILSYFVGIWCYLSTLDVFWMEFYVFSVKFEAILSIWTILSYYGTF